MYTRIIIIGVEHNFQFQSSLDGFPRHADTLVFFLLYMLLKQFTFDTHSLKVLARPGLIFF